MGATASMAGDKSESASNVKVVGLMGMGLSLMLIGLSLLPPPYSNGFANFGPAIPTAGFFGGIVLVIAGLGALWRNHMFWGSAFAAYGAFFTVWTVTIPNHGGGVLSYGLAGFSFVFLMMTLTFLLSSRKHGWLTFFLFLFFALSLILWTVAFWMSAAGNTISNGQWWATGGLTILTGLTAWYMATAALTNWTYGKQYLPG